MRRLRSAVPLLLTLVAGCGDDGVGPVDRVVAGVDLDVLFAEPTGTEIEAVLTDWAGRRPSVSDVEVVRDSIVVVDGTDIRVRIVSHRVDDRVHHGAVLVADERVDPTVVLIYAHGGDGGVALDEVFSLLPFLGDDAARFVWVVPSFRSEPLRFAGGSWSSEGPASPWDGDVDDALSLLRVAYEVEPRADSTRVGVLGFSRGAGVGLLMAARDPSIDRVVEFFGPTDFFGPFAQTVVEQALRGMAPDLPGVAYLDEAFIQPLARDEMTMASARDQLLRRSPVYFAERLPAVQIHHGTGDDVVAVGQAEALADALTELGRTGPDFESFIYPGGAHNPLTLQGSVGRAVTFLRVLTQEGSTAARD